MELNSTIAGVDRHDKYHILTLHADKDQTLKIVRPWCSLISWKERQLPTHKESNQMETLLEKASSHRDLIFQISNNQLKQNDDN
ncbi:hypothetical protein GCM10027347_44330 [Larkinella harenae]